MKKIKLFPALMMMATVLASEAAAARSARVAPPDCALDAQRSIARRHGLHEAVDNSLSLKIYDDPKLAQEADDAFDACIRHRLVP